MYSRMSMPLAETESQVDVNMSHLTCLAASHSRDDGSASGGLGVGTDVTAAAAAASSALS